MKQAIILSILFYLSMHAALDNQQKESYFHLLINQLRQQHPQQPPLDPRAYPNEPLPRFSYCMYLTPFIMLPVLLGFWALGRVVVCLNLDNQWWCEPHNL